MQNVKFVPHPLGPKCSNEPKICQTTPPHRSTLHLAQAVHQAGHLSALLPESSELSSDMSGYEWRRVDAGLHQIYGAQHQLYIEPLNRLQFLCFF